MERKNNKLFKILIIVLDIVTILVLSYTYINWKNNKTNKTNNVDETIDNNNSNSNSNSSETTNKVRYKKFDFEFPSNVKYSEIDDKEFLLETDTYHAVIEIFIDEQGELFNDPTPYYQTLLKLEWNVDTPEKTKIANEDVILIKNHHEYNSVLCYLKAFDDFYYEINLFNEDNSFSTDRLPEIIDMLKTAMYDYNSQEKYTYGAIDYNQEKE